MKAIFFERGTCVKFIFLATDFFQKNPHLKEVENKNNRPYSVFLITIDNIEFAIPLRSSLQHNNFFSSLNITNKEKKDNAYSKKGNVGLDYSKSIIIQNANDIRNDTGIVFVSEKEHNYLKGKEYLVKVGMEKYIKKYIKAYDKQHIRSNKFLCDYSTLQNYHEEIGLKTTATNLFL